MSDTVSLVLTALVATLGALIASDPTWLSDTAQGIIGAVLVGLAAVGIKRPGREPTALK